MAAAGGSHSLDSEGKTRLGARFFISGIARAVFPPVGGVFATGEKGRMDMSIMDGCQGKPRTPTIQEKICPRCGNTIEIFSTDTEVACEKCGFVAYNDTLTCVQWCKYARKCVGDEMYEKMMEIAAQQERRAAEARQKQEGKV